MRDKTQVFAIVRVEQGAAAREDDITVVGIYPTLEDAESQTARLNSLNQPKGCRYFWQTTRYYARES
jgi:hypothetical protein